MIRLDFELPEWTRVIWNSQIAKEIWQPRFFQISNAFLEIEKALVLKQMKPACLTIMPAKSVVNLQIDLQKTDFCVLPLQKTQTGASYSNREQPLNNNSEYQYRVVLTHKDQVNDWQTAWFSNNNEKIGQLLGFPKCCRDFFQEYWVNQKYIDLSWPMSLNGAEGPKECNMLLRWLGIRAVSHLPCGFNCHETYKIGRTNIEFARSQGFQQEMDWLEQVLDWPVQWSALHGIAEIKTPVCKISTNTVATGDKLVINKPGYSYPDEGSQGNQFPYNQGKKLVTQSNSFKRSLLLENQWKDNGFVSFEAMNASHQQLIQVVKSMNQPINSIIDFGCGNGELLKTFKNIYPNIEMSGVELNTARFGRIKFNHETGHWFNLNMFDSTGSWFDKNYDLAFVMPGRLLETDEESQKKFLFWLQEKVKNIAFYAYGDWIEKFNDIIDKLKFYNLYFENINTQKSDACIVCIGKITSKKTVMLNII